MLDWQLTPGGLLAKGKHTYHIFKSPHGAVLQVQTGSKFETTGTFAGEHAFREARELANRIENGR